MLDRAQPSRQDQRRKRRAAWQRTYRRRQREGCKLIEVTAPVIELAIEGKWLKPDEADDKLAIRDALDAMAKASLKNFR
jgi:hypothetical protein